MRFNKAKFQTDWFIGLVIMLSFLVVSEFDLLNALDLHAYNLGVQFSSEKDPHEDIVVIAIDDKSLRALGSWPWSRDVLAETMQLIGKAKPTVTGFSMPFDMGQYEASLASVDELRQILKKEKKLSRRVNRVLNITESTLHGDDNLASSFKAAGRVVLAMPYIASKDSGSGLTKSLPKYMQGFSLPNISVDSNVNKGFGWPKPELTRAEALFPPIAPLARRVGGIGVIGLNDSFIREPLVVRYGQDYLPSFALMMATRSKGMSMQHVVSRLSEKPMLGGKELDTDINYHIYPRFYDDQNGKAPFKIYSLIDVLDNTVNISEFHEKIILIGITSPRLARPQLTPTGQSISPTVAVAHSVSSLLNGELFNLPDWAGWAQRGILVGIGLYLMLLLGRFRLAPSFFLSLFLLLMIFNAHFMMMSVKSIWLPMMSAAVMLIVGHLILGTRQYVNLRLQQVRSELSISNRQLGQSLHAQGHLDQAFEKLRDCNADDSLLGQMYNLGLDYERKRKFNKAVSVFNFIQDHNSKYEDVAERIDQNTQAANTVVLGGSSNNGPGATLISSKDGISKPKLGRYEIDREIGRGAMGMVYLGHDDKIGRTVAIKTMVISDEIEDDMREEVKTRFFREAEAVGRLDHPNIVTVYDVGDEQDLAYIAMDFLKGKDLTAYSSAKTLLPVLRVFEIIMNIAMALDYAHQQHVVHRDIKPANIIYDDQAKTAKITDFGVACLTDASKTKTGTVLGSPYYMSPEQLAGKKVDGRADLFSLGVTMYQMLSAELPFKGDSMANLMYNIANEKHTDIRRYKPDLPTCVATVINKSLHKEAERRYQSGKQMAAAIKRCHDQVKESQVA
jgi:CHASE2 domain-containing sensor protein/tRNA A-37 threonylcarbamoyl transferase component Bud32